MFPSINYATNPELRYIVAVLISALDRSDYAANEKPMDNDILISVEKAGIIGTEFHIHVQQHDSLEAAEAASQQQAGVQLKVDSFTGTVVYPVYCVKGQDVLFVHTALADDLKHLDKFTPFKVISF